MTTPNRMLALAQLSLQDPRRGARALFAENVPAVARRAGLLLVAVASAIMASLQIALDPLPLDPYTALILGSPFRAALFQWLFLGLSVLLIHKVGRAFGGTGSLPDALLLVVWLQVLMLGVQLVQLAATLVAPPLAGIIGLAGFGLFLWLMTTFIAELHGFASRGWVFLGMMVTAIATGLVFGVVLILMLGPEAFVNV